MIDYSALTFREAVQQTLLNSERLSAAGLPEGSVFDADTVDGPLPEQFPFLVHRWNDVESGMAHMTVRPFTLFAYGKAGKQDKTLLELLLGIASEELVELVGVAKLGGFLHSFEDRRQGGDLFDAGFDANVIPRNMVVVGSGT